LKTFFRSTSAPETEALLGMGKTMNRWIETQLGFSVAELLVAFAVLALLVALALPHF
jgi:type II secretory pathway pseudopilin PulG